MKKHFSILLALSLLPISTSQCKDDKYSARDKLDLLIGCATLALMGYGCYWLYNKYNPTKPTPPTPSQEPAIPQINKASEEGKSPEEIAQEIREKINPDPKEQENPGLSSQENEKTEEPQEKSDDTFVEKDRTPIRDLIKQEKNSDAKPNNQDLKKALSGESHTILRNPDIGKIFKKHLNILQEG